MRHINKKRELAENERHRHWVKRGLKRKVHFENILWLGTIIKFLLRVTFVKHIGEKNAADLNLESVDFVLPNLPKSFDNLRIMLITDLHLDSMKGVGRRILKITENLDFDYCILGGDYGKNWDNTELLHQRIRDIVHPLLKKARVFGVLGNHDKYQIAEVLEQAGVQMLINEGLVLEKNNDKLYLAGIDDCHYYNQDDVQLADEHAEENVFKIMISHSPEKYDQVEKAGYELYLAGHTHGGQICLPFGVALITGATVPRRMVKGKWKYHRMQGYTSRGIGTTAIKARYFCPPEITLITLRKSSAN